MADREQDRCWLIAGFVLAWMLFAITVTFWASTARADESLADQARPYVGQRNPTGFRGPWCGSFVGMVADKAGVKKPDGFRQAKNWIHAGPRLTRAQPGAIAVMENHVGIVLAVHDKGVIIISGNFSRRVAISFVSLRHIRAFVEPVT